MTNQRYWWG